VSIIIIIRRRRTRGARGEKVSLMITITINYMLNRIYAYFTKIT
jgi:hypothetical protein